MSETKVRKNETIDSALRRFKRTLARDGVLAESRETRSIMRNPAFDARRNLRLHAREDIDIPCVKFELREDIEP